MAHPSIRTYRKYFSSLALRAKAKVNTPKRDQAPKRVLVRALGQ